MAARSTEPVYHYLDIGRLGRGEVLNLFLKDAGINVQEVRYAYDDTWPKTSEELKRRGITRTGKVPALEYHGSIQTQHLPILRFLARDLGRYDGETNWDKYVIDAVSDIYIDWRSQWVANLKNVTSEYRDAYVPDYYNVLGQYYADREGPYLLGDRITYADFAVYQSIDNDQRIGTLPSALPDSIVKFKTAFEGRPNISAYIRETK